MAGIKILITGARGFLAGSLAAELRRRHRRARLFLLHRKSSPQKHRLGQLSSKTFSRAPGFVACDLLDAEIVRKTIARLQPDLIFHLAGNTGPETWSGLWRAHVETTVNLLDATLALIPHTRVIVAGSSAEYGTGSAGSNKKNRSITEDVLAQPLNPYGASKLCETLAALSYSRRGLSVIVARIFNVLGPGMPDHLALGTFSHQIARIEGREQPPELHVGNLSPKRDYIDVRDAARALADLGDRGASGEIYNICSGRSYSIGVLLNRLLRMSKLAPKTSFGTAVLGDVSEGDIRVIRDPARVRTAEAMDIRGSYRKLNILTGWKPRIRIEQSLKDTLQWHRRH